MKWLDLLWQLGEGAAWNVIQQMDRWRAQLLQSLLLIVLAAVCGLAVLVLTACLALLAYWDTHRYEVLWLLLLAYAGMGVWLIRRAGPWGSGARVRQGRCGPCASCADSRARGGCRAGS